MRASASSALPVHPRMCGERPQSPPPSTSANGSSPHVRGTHGICGARGAQGRFIPACAGNALRRSGASSNQPVHPRMCGERGVQLSDDLSLYGSSPHVRGTRADIRHIDPMGRFIPACAGNARRGGRGFRATSVHPRMCGERRLTPRIDRGSTGSSPHVRGTHGRKTRGRARLRFIPACAGNASQRWRSLLPFPVHPRMCGERDVVRLPRHAAGGSSPHVRGTPRLSRPQGQALRFIPACAGNALGMARAPAPTPVHPRMCGERP